MYCTTQGAAGEATFPKANKQQKGSSSILGRANPSSRQMSELETRFGVCDNKLDDRPVLLSPRAGRRAKSRFVGRPPQMTGGLQRAGSRVKEQLVVNRSRKPTRIGKPEVTVPAPGEVLRHGAALVSSIVMKFTGVRGLKATLK